MWNFTVDIQSKEFGKMGVFTVPGDSAELVDGSLYITRNGERFAAFDAPLDNEQYAENLRQKG